ncbi:MAG: NfeD family protein [Syntrophotaleaceae bacterium]
MGNIPKVAYLRYLLMNLPGMIGLILVLILIGHWISLPGWMFWLILGLWIAKDFLLFPFVWRSYLPTDSTDSASLAGQKGVVKKRLDPGGYIEVRGELWRAERMSPGPPVEVGRIVHIRRREGLSLFVTEDDCGEIDKKQQ